MDLDSKTPECVAIQDEKELQIRGYRDCFAKLALRLIDSVCHICLTYIQWTENEVWYSFTADVKVYADDRHQNVFGFWTTRTDTSVF